MKVIVHGSVSVFPRDGAYQLYVSSMQPDGIGALYLAYEQLKSKLSSEGLFSDEHKKLLPEMPERIGVITSPTGAAVRDIINVVGRRFPLAKIYIYPALVQGSGSEENLIRGLDYLDKSGLVDVIIIGRGGGSIEDLWSFNSERLARKIFDAKVPIISAVGHETDFTICDFVADMRAPTPSAAAEIAVPDVRELYMRLDAYSGRISNSLEKKIEIATERFYKLREKIIDGRLDSYFSNIVQDISDKRKSVTSLIAQRIERECGRFVTMSEKLAALNPLSILMRGYSLSTKENGDLVTVDNVSLGDNIFVKINNGKIKAEVIEVCEDNI